MSHPDVKAEVQVGEGSAYISHGANPCVVRADLDHKFVMTPHTHGVIRGALAHLGNPIFERSTRDGMTHALTFNFRSPTVGCDKISTVDAVKAAMEALHSELSRHLRSTAPSLATA